MDKPVYNADQCAYIDAILPYGGYHPKNLSILQLSPEARADLAAAYSVQDLVDVVTKHNCFGCLDDIVMGLLSGPEENTSAR